MSDKLSTERRTHSLKKLPCGRAELSSRIHAPKRTAAGPAAGQCYGMMFIGWVSDLRTALTRTEPDRP